MKRYFILLMSCALMLAASCQQETLQSDTTDLEFILNTPDIFSEGQVSITVKSGHPSFRFTEFSFPLAPDMVKLGTEYSIDNISGWTMTYDLGPISADLLGSGYIEGEMEDVATGKRVRFKELYHAYTKRDVALIIDNRAILNEQGQQSFGGVYIGRTAYPTLVGGDRLDFHLNISKDSFASFVVSGFDSNLSLAECETNLVLNETYSPDKDGNIYFHFENVAVDKDRIVEEDLAWLRLTLTDTQTKNTVTVGDDAKFVTLRPFTPQAEILPEKFYHGADIKIVFTLPEGRNSFLVSDIKENISFGLNKVPSFDCTDNVYIHEVSEIQAPKLGPDSLVVTLVDADYTRRSATICIPFEVVEQPAPSSFQLIATRDKNYIYHKLAYANDFDSISDEPIPFDLLTKNSATNPLLINKGETISVKVETDKYVQKKFSVRNLGTTWQFATVKDKTSDGSWAEFEIYGSEPRQNGVSPFEISVVGNETVVDTFYVQTRYVVSFEFGGKFYDKLSAEPCAHFNENQGGRQGIGWIGIPEYLCVRCVSISDDVIKSLGDITEKSLKSLKLKETTLTPIKAPTSINYTVKFDCSQPTISAVRYYNNWDDYRYGGLLLLDRHTSGIYCENGVHHNFKQRNAPDSDYPLASDYPSKKSSLLSSTLSANYSGMSSIAPGYGKIVGNDSFEFNQILLGMNNNCWYEVRHSTFDVSLPQHNVPKEEYINVFVSNLSYNHSCVFVPFIINTMGPVDDTDYINGATPWWWDKQEAKYKGFRINTF